MTDTTVFLDNEEPFIAATVHEIEFDEDEAEEIRPLRELGLRADLCHTLDLIETEEGPLFVEWRERHPHMPDFEEFFEEGVSRDDPDCVAKFRARQKKLPPVVHRRRISEADATELVCRLWLPTRFQRSLGFC